jgi:superfamily II DNA helicase RecQ
MQAYAYHTGCRRHFVLRYFGDPAAGSRCTGCDNCLGIKHEVVAPALPTAVPKPGGGRTRARTAGGRSGGAPEVSPTDLVLGPEEAALFNALKAVRGELARAEQVPAYVVFPDRTLAEFAVRRPRTLSAMGDVRGVGPTKLEKYGDRFLRALREAEGTEAA